MEIRLEIVKESSTFRDVRNVVKHIIQILQAIIIQFYIFHSRIHFSFFCDFSSILVLKNRQ